MTHRQSWSRTAVGIVQNCAGGAGLLLLFLAVGCSGGDEFPSGSASGTVTFKGQPVKEGMVYVYNVETAYANQSEIRDGNFELPGEIRTGTYKLYVTPIPPAPGSPFEPIKNIGTGDFPPGVPEKYQLQDKSDLTVVIEEGSKEVAIVIPEA